MPPVCAATGVYVITTFLFDFHMGRLECVTCHGPERKSSVGGVKFIHRIGDEEVEGARKERGRGLFDIFASLVYSLYIVFCSCEGEAASAISFHQTASTIAGR